MQMFESVRLDIKLTLPSQPSSTKSAQCRIEQVIVDDPSPKPNAIFPVGENAFDRDNLLLWVMCETLTP